MFGVVSAMIGLGMSRTFFAKDVRKSVLASDRDLAGIVMQKRVQFLKKYTRLAQPLHFRSCFGIRW